MNAKKIGTVAVVALLLVASLSPAVLARYGGDAVSDTFDIYDEADTLDELDNASRSGVVNLANSSDESTAYISPLRSAAAVSYESKSQLSTVATNWDEDIDGEDDMSSISGTDDTGYLVVNDSSDSTATVAVNSSQTGRTAGTTGTWQATVDANNGSVKWWWLGQVEDGGDYTQYGYFLQITDADESDDTETLKIRYRTPHDGDDDNFDYATYTFINTTISEGQHDWYITRYKNSDGSFTVKLYDGQVSEYDLVASDTHTPVLQDLDKVTTTGLSTRIKLTNDARVGSLNWAEMPNTDASYTFSASSSDIEGGYVDFTMGEGADGSVSLYAYNDSSGWTKLDTRVMAPADVADGDTTKRFSVVIRERNNLTDSEVSNLSSHTIVYTNSESYSKYRVEVHTTGPATVNRMGLLYTADSGGVIGTVDSGGSGWFWVAAGLLLIVFWHRRREGDDQ